MFVEYKGRFFKRYFDRNGTGFLSSISYAGNQLAAIRNVEYVVVKNSIFNGDQVF
jgi:GMP reductase